MILVLTFGSVSIIIGAVAALMLFVQNVLQAFRKRWKWSSARHLFNGLSLTLGGIGLLRSASHIRVNRELVAAHSSICINAGWLSNLGFGLMVLGSVCFIYGELRHEAEQRRRAVTSALDNLGLDFE